MTNPVYRGTSQLTNTTTGTSPTTISGQAVGDILIGVAFNNAAMTGAPGWTSFSGGNWATAAGGNPGQDSGSAVYQYFAWRKADGTGNDAFAPTWAGGTTSGALYVAGFSGQDSTTPIDNSDITQWSNSGTATTFPPSSTPSVADDVHIVIYGEGSGPKAITTPPAGYTQIVANQAGGSQLGMYYKALSGQSGVSQGPINMVWASAAAYGPAVSILIKAAGGGGGGGSTGSRMLLMGMF